MEDPATGEPLLIDLDGPLDWQEHDIPGGSEPVRLARLRVGVNTVNAVRFPAGWRRAADGAYESAEEFTVLTGALHMSGAIFVEPHWAYVPAGWRRTNTHVHEEVLAVARFEGPPRWREGTGEVFRVLESTPLGPDRELRPAHTRLVAALGPEPAAETLEVLSTRARRWAWVPAGASIPALEGPLIVRTVEEER